MIETYCCRTFPRRHRDIPPEIEQALQLAKRDNRITPEIRSLCDPWRAPINIL
jgi:hypothetical protein